MGFDLQRFISVRDGPNVRQSYDAVWVDYERGLWRFISFYSHPVQNRDLRPFDDYSNNHLTYGGFRAERQLTSDSSLSVILSRFTQDGARFPSVSGNERRNILDLHYAGKHAGIDWDLEAMRQGGDMGGDSIRAWAVGNLAGYTFAAAPWTPRLGLQVDAASGDKNRNDRQLNTFNPLFPKLPYFSEANLATPANLLDIQPNLTLTVTPRVTFNVGWNPLWKEAEQDAFYAPPLAAVTGTTGRSGSFMGQQLSTTVSWTIIDRLSISGTYVHYTPGDRLREIGGKSGDFFATWAQWQF